MRAIPQPNYSLLTAANIALVLESPGLIGGSNRYGVVSAEGNLTQWRGIRPGVSGRNFNATGVGFVRRETANGIAVVGGSDKAFLRSADAATTYNFLHHQAVFSDLKWTVTMLCRIGFGSQPGDLSPFFGNNGISQSNKGIVVYMDDRNTNNLNLGHALTRAVAGSPISTSFDAVQVTPNEWAIWRFTFDGALTAANRFKAFKNKVQLTTTVTSSSTATVTTPSFALEFFAGGNGLNGVGSWQCSHIIIENTVESTPAQEAFEDSLLPYLNALNANPNKEFHPYSVRKDDGTKYYLSTKICQNPTSPSTVVKIYAIANQHAIVSGDIQTIYIAKSTDYGRTFAAESVLYTTGDPFVTSGDWGGGYDSLGRLWIFTETRTTNTVDNLPFGAKIIYSDDDGATTTVQDIAAIIPADGLSSWAMRGQLIETSTGRLIFQFYKWSSGFATSANYTLYSDDRSTWGIKTIRAVDTPSRNEAGAFLVGDGVTEKIVVYLRDDDTDEWHIYSSTDDGDTYTDEGAEDFGIVLVNAGPISFEKFLINGIGVIAGYFSDRTTAPYDFLAIYGRAGLLFADSHNFDEQTMTNIIVDGGYHYMSICHPENSIFALGLSGREPNPLTNTENDLVTFFMPNYQLDLVKQQLGIT